MKFNTLLIPFFGITFSILVVISSFFYSKYESDKLLIKEAFANASKERFFRIKEQVRALFEYRQFSYKLEEQNVKKYHQSLLFTYKSSNDLLSSQNRLNNSIRKGTIALEVYSIDKFDKEFITLLNEQKIIIDPPLIDFKTKKFASESYTISSTGDEILVLKRFLLQSVSWQDALIKLVRKSRILNSLEIWESSEYESQRIIISRKGIQYETIDSSWFNAFKELFLEDDPIAIENKHNEEGGDISYQFLLQGTVYPQNKQLFGIKILLNPSEMVEQLAHLKSYFIKQMFLTCTLGVLFLGLMYFLILRPLRYFDIAVSGFKTVKNPSLLNRHDEIGRLIQNYELSRKTQITLQESQRERIEEKETLLKEIHHRVKNNLAVIMSLVRLQSRNLKSEKEKREFLDLQNRIKSMELIHRSLYQSENLANVDFAVYIEKLVNELLHSSVRHGLEIEMLYKITISPLDIDRAITCGLVINEVISNSLKYAFETVQKGEITIAMVDTNGEYHLTIFDNGCGKANAVKREESTSFGSKLIKTLVERQLKGVLSELPLQKGYGVDIIFKH